TACMPAPRPRPCGCGARPSSIPSPRSSTVSSAIPGCCCEAPAARRSKSGSPPWPTTCNASSTCSAAQHSPKNSTLHDAKQERSPTGSAPSNQTDEFRNRLESRAFLLACGNALPAHLVRAASGKVIGASEGEHIGCETVGQFTVGGEPVLVFEVGAQVDAVVQAVIQAAAEGDEVVADIVDVGHDAARGNELVRGKVHNAAAIEDLAVGSQPATIVVAKVAATDFVSGFGEVIAWNQGILVGISDPMEIGFEPVVLEEVIVGVEGEAADVVRHIVGMSPAEAGADLKVCVPACSGRGLTVDGGNEEG